MRVYDRQESSRRDVPAMPSSSPHPATRLRHPLHAVLLGGIVAAALDIGFAIGFWALQEVPATRILQSIAAGLLGGRAYTGGGATAALGLALHVAIACVMAWVFYLASRRWRALTRHPLIAGAAYGVMLYATMNWIVVPLSAAALSPPRGLWLWCGLAAHIVLVGIPCALAARAADRIAQHRTGQRGSHLR